MELSGSNAQATSPMDPYRNMQRDISPSQVSNSSVQYHSQPGYVIEGQHFQNKSLEHQIVDEEFDKMEDVNHDDNSSDSDESQTVQEMAEETTNQAFSQAKDLLKGELDKTFQEFEQKEKVTPT